MAPLLGLAVLALIGQPVFSGTPTIRPTSDNPAQDRLVAGQVISGDDNKPLPGVSVTVKGTTRGTTTDADGNYRISVPNNNAALVFSAVGFVSQEVTVGAQTTLNLTRRRTHGH